MPIARPCVRRFEVAQDDDEDTTCSTPAARNDCFPGARFRETDVGIGSAATVRRQWEQSLAEHRPRLANPPTRPASAERQVRRQSGQPPEDLGNVRYRRPPTFAGQIRATATSLKRSHDEVGRRSANGREFQFADCADS